MRSGFLCACAPSILIFSVSAGGTYLLLSFWFLLLQMEKTEKTMAELEIDRNMSWEFDAITEAGKHLQPLSGPG